MLHVSPDTMQRIKPDDNIQSGAVRKTPLSWQLWAGMIGKRFSKSSNRTGHRCFAIGFTYLLKV